MRQNNTLVAYLSIFLRLFECGSFFKAFIDCVGILLLFYALNF